MEEKRAALHPGEGYCPSFGKEERKKKGADVSVEKGDYHSENELGGGGEESRFALKGGGRSHEEKKQPLYWKKKKWERNKPKKKKKLGCRPLLKKKRGGRTATPSAAKMGRGPIPPSKGGRRERKNGEVGRVEKGESRPKMDKSSIIEKKGEGEKGKNHGLKRAKERERKAAGGKERTRKKLGHLAERKKGGSILAPREWATFVKGGGEG